MDLRRILVGVSEVDSGGRDRASSADSRMVRAGVVVSLWGRHETEDIALVVDLAPDIALVVDSVPAGLLVDPHTSIDRRDRLLVSDTGYMTIWCETVPILTR